MAPNGSIYFHEKSPNYSADFSKTNLGLQAHFVHEMMHVQQYQSSSVFGSFKNLFFERNPFTGGGGDYYDYGDLGSVSDSIH